MAAVGGAHRQVDPSADAHPAPFRGLVGARVVPPRRARREDLRVPVRGLREDGLLLGEQLGSEGGAHAVEVGGGGRAQLGVRVAGGGEERVPEPAAVHGVV